MRSCKRKLHAKASATRLSLHGPGLALVSPTSARLKTEVLLQEQQL